MKRILIAAGGTGGHFYPGFSLAQTLRQKGWETVFLVRKGDSAIQTLEAEGLAFVEIPLRGMPRNFSGWGRFIFGLFSSLRLSLNIVSDFKPDIVLGMGGYLSFPAILAAALNSRPRLVHESNVVLGFSNKICVLLGAKLLRGLPGEKGILVGTPIRPALRQRLDPETARRRLGLDLAVPTLLIFGGSQGARGINLQVPEILKNLSKKFPRGLQVLHLSGKEENAVLAAYQGAEIKVLVKNYFNSMEEAYGAADLVLCRAGASTIAELHAQKKPALLIPFPSATANHQWGNARVLEEAGAARILPEEKIQERLLNLIEKTLLSPGSKETLESMEKAYERLALPTPNQSSQNLARLIEQATDSK